MSRLRSIQGFRGVGSWATGGEFGAVCHKLFGPDGSPAHAIWPNRLPNSRARRGSLNRRAADCGFESHMVVLYPGPIPEVCGSQVREDRNSVLPASYQLRSWRRRLSTRFARSILPGFVRRILICVIIRVIVCIVLKVVSRIKTSVPRSTRRGGGRSRGACAPGGNDVSHFVHRAGIIRGVRGVDSVIDSGRPSVDQDLRV